MTSFIAVPGPIVHRVEALALYETVAAPPPDEPHILRTELRELVRGYTARLRADGVPPEQMIATIKAIVRRALRRVGLHHAGVFLLEVLDWGLEGYYEGCPA